MKHLFLGLIIRLALIFYGEFHDQKFQVPFTDVDYKVFTDAARNVLMGASPYSRHTYRYSPIVAYVLTPNIIVHQTFGKVLFSILDLVMAYLIYKLMLKRNISLQKAHLSSLFWLYNPLSVVISTRGNADTLSSLLVASTLLCLYAGKPTVAGIVHGLCIHMRLYPVVFSLPFYLSLSNGKRFLRSNEKRRKGPSQSYTNSNETLKADDGSSFTGRNLSYLWSDCKAMFTPNKCQFKLVLGCVSALLTVTIVFYWLYGYHFLYESMLFHLTRKDIRHNFSVYFYLQYLSAGAVVSVWQRVLMFIPQLFLLVALSFRYGRMFDLPFCLLAQTIVIVMYNPVITSQYFIWFLSLLPACIPMLDLTVKQAVFHSIVWVVAQVAWLLPAYWLEFRGEDTFVYIWLQGIAFFCANMTLLARLIQSYNPKLVLKED
ncbi:GPI mannosyltransferase 1 [Frankliniella fusca]|uniref:GPI alpha-1,4-mannosyltransferase I, catalytic subunit n=1 Tax=Frankliniella fusca TaxID=407009 RepID=A0AAE1LBI4_9NEOP|nr:GPI mannosyltransferase 1 [Frankliniella fusca]